MTVRLGLRPVGIKHTLAGGLVVRPNILVVCHSFRICSFLTEEGNSRHKVGACHDGVGQGDVW